MSGFAWRVWRYLPGASRNRVSRFCGTSRFSIDDDFTLAIRLGTDLSFFSGVTVFQSVCEVTYTGHCGESTDQRLNETVPYLKNTEHCLNQTLVCRKNNVGESALPGFCICFPVPRHEASLRVKRTEECPMALLDALPASFQNLIIETLWPLFFVLRLERAFEAIVKPEILFGPFSCSPLDFFGE
jgi:hypothetical protein